MAGWATGSRGAPEGCAWLVRGILAAAQGRPGCGLVQTGANVRGESPGVGVRRGALGVKNVWLVRQVEELVASFDVDSGLDRVVVDWVGSRQTHRW